jgi:thiol-disulfide isomerase/thioredoxin
MTDLDFLQTDPAPPSRGFRLSLGGVLLIGAILIVAFIVGLALARQSQTQPTAGIAPDFTVTPFDGVPFTLSEQRGRIVVLNFWASWCGPCRVEVPILERLWQDYRDRGVIVLGVTYADNERDSRAFMEQFNVTYLVAPDIGTIVSKERYHITGVPETFIIDQNGEIARFIFADIDAQDDIEIRALLDSLLAEGGA